MERLQERHHSPSLTRGHTHTLTDTHTHSGESQSCTLQQRWEENAASRKIDPPSGLWNTRKPWFPEEEDILSSGYKCVCVVWGSVYWKWECVEYTHLSVFNLKPKLRFCGVLISSPSWWLRVYRLNCCCCFHTQHQCYIKGKQAGEHRLPPYSSRLVVRTKSASKKITFHPSSELIFEVKNQEVKIRSGISGVCKKFRNNQMTKQKKD